MADTNNEADLTDDDNFLESREVVMRIIGAFVKRSGGHLEITSEEMDVLDDHALGFSVDENGAAFWLTTDKAN